MCSDRELRLLIAVGVFAALTVVYLTLGVANSVFWTVYGFGLKDLLIIALLMGNLHKEQARALSLASIGVSCYLVVPTLTRLSCAVKTDWGYEAYKELINSSTYPSLLLSAMLVISIIIYYEYRNERKTR